MKLPLSLANLVDDPRRLAVAVAGVAFATTLILMQLGFLGAVYRSAVLVYDRLEFDLLMRSPRYVVLTAPGQIPEQRLIAAESVPGVALVSPLSVGVTTFRNPESGSRRPILVLGIDPDASPFDLQGLPLDRLRRSGAALADARSNKAFGFRDEGGNLRAPGYETEAGGSTVRVEGYFDMGTGFSADGAILVNRDTFRRLCAVGPNRVTFGLVTLEGGADADTVATAIERTQPRDTSVETRKSALAREQDHWAHEEPLGIIFMIGLAVSVVVGIAVVYQLLSADIAERFTEYATLKAMGYRRGQLSLLVLQQAAALALTAFPPALALASGLDWAARHYQNVPVSMWGWRVAAAFLMTLTMCVTSGLLSIRKVQVADPAELF